MPAATLKPVFQFWNRLLRLVLALGPLVVTTNTHAVKYKQFKVTDLKTTTTGEELLSQLELHVERMKLSAGSEVKIYGLEYPPPDPLGASKVTQEVIWDVHEDSTVLLIPSKLKS